MGDNESKSFTENGLKNIYLSILLSIPFCIVTFLTGSFGLTGGAIAVFLVGVLFVFIFFIKGMSNMLNGREELNEKHSTNAVMATVFSTIAIILFLVLMVLSISAGSVLTSSIKDILSFVAAAIVVLALSIAFMIFIGISLIYYIQEITPPDKKRFLNISFGMLIGFPILAIVVVQFGQIFCILAGLVLILPMYLFLVCYKTSLEYLQRSDIKAVPLVPCPYCEHVIPVTSTSCRHCGAEFKKEDIEQQIDRRFIIDKPKYSHPAAPHGYTPVEGPSEEERTRVKKLITLAIILIVVLAVVFAVYSFLTSDNSEDTDEDNIDASIFVGTWQGGAYFGDDFETDKTWVFYNNGSLSAESLFGEEWYTYYLEGNSFCRKNMDTLALICYSYEFSNNRNTLFLSIGDVPSYKLNKI